MFYFYMCFNVVFTFAALARCHYWASRIANVYEAAVFAANIGKGFCWEKAAQVEGSYGAQPGVWIQ